VGWVATGGRVMTRMHDAAHASRTPSPQPRPPGAMAWYSYESMHGIDGRFTPPAGSPPNEGAETPIRRAQRLARSPQIATMPRTTRVQMMRVASPTVLISPVVELLDREAASLKVCKWVSGGRWVQDRVLRLALAVYLRREAEPCAPGPPSASGWVWPKNAAMSAAEKVFRRSPQHARLVAQGVCLAPGQIAAFGKAIEVGQRWDAHWGALQRELASLDRAAFLAEVRAVERARKRRTRRRRPRPLAPAQAALADAVKTILRAVVRGNLTAGALAEGREEEKEQ
jgi:hypothetical protein